MYNLALYSYLCNFRTVPMSSLLIHFQYSPSMYLRYHTVIHNSFYKKKIINSIHYPAKNYLILYKHMKAERKCNYEQDEWNEDTDERLHNLH